MGAKIDNLYKYAAFISYAHADEAVAKKLHVALETYPLPKGMDKAERNKLFPVFRDVTELTAHHSLSEKIRAAVKTSRFLIVLCSPASKKSHWVNEEIKLFRKLHGEGSILAVIVDGVPDTAFPPALTADGREPLAANMATNEGFRFGVSQLAASMLGVGLDTLVQRDQKRRRLRTQLVTAVTTTLAVVMGALAWTAIDARDDAEVAQAKAEVSRDEAEELVDYMLTDLKGELEAVGRLPILNGVGDKVADYYDAIPLTDMDDDRLGRRSEARHLLGQVYLKQGLDEKSLKEFEAAFLATEEVFSRNRTDHVAIFSHAQSQYWMGEYFHLNRRYNEALPYWNNYRELGTLLYSIDNLNPDWIMESGYGELNLGLLHRKQTNYDISLNHYFEAANFFKEAIVQVPNDHSKKFDLALVYSGISNVYSEMNNPQRAIEARKTQKEILSRILDSDPENFGVRLRVIYSRLNLERLQSKTIGKCNIERWNSHFDDLRSLHEVDPTNYNVTHDFIHYKTEYLQMCEQDFPRVKFQEYVANLEVFLDKKARPEDLIKQKVWLAEKTSQ